MRVHYGIALSLCLLSTPALALKCNPEGTQMEMNQCAADDFAKADQALNDAYQALRKKYKDNKPYLKQLKQAQRAWIKFRDAELAAMFACDDEMRMCWGSMYPLLHLYEKETLTENRTKQLKLYLEKGPNPAAGAMESTSQ
ncbi:MAG TPA: DUF1311 domain-containing protein [Thiothrix sp.]|nr:DUF1311 domain-containing protein [Thiothrix sp.]